MQSPIFIVLVLLLAGCGDDPLRIVSGRLAVDATELVIEPAWVGNSAERLLALRNDGDAAVLVEFGARPPFSVAEGSVRLRPAERRTVAVRFLADVEGAQHGLLELRSSDGSRHVVQLTGRAAAVPACTTEKPCWTGRFDPHAGACIEEAIPNGVACASACLEEGAVCSNGSCLGEPIVCDDGLVCTADVCSLNEGCVHLEDPALACPESAGPCRIPTCSPGDGCGYEALADGTPCGTAACGGARVCIAGTCVERPLPEGGACDTPCGAGTCQEGVCVADGILQPIWELADALPRRRAFALDANENLYWQQSSLDSTRLRSVTPDGIERFSVKLPRRRADERMGWDDSLRVIGEQVLLYPHGGSEIYAFSAKDGSLSWQRDLTDFVRKPVGETVEYDVTQIAAANGIVVLASWNDGMPGTDHPGWLVSFDHNGELRWMYELAGPCSGFLGSLLVSEEGLILVATDWLDGARDLGSRLEAVGPDGERKWLVSFPASSLSLLAVGSGYAVAEVWEGGPADQPGLLVRIEDGTTYPIANMPSGYFLNPASLVGPGLAYFVAGGGTGTFAAVSLIERRSVWQIIPDLPPHPNRPATPGRIHATWAALTTDHALVAAAWRYLAQNWHLFGVGADGVQKYRCAIAASPGTSSVDDSPIAILGDETWYIPHGYEGIHAYRLKGVKPARAGWVAPRGNATGDMRAR